MGWVTNFVYSSMLAALISFLLQKQIWMFDLTKKNLIYRLFHKPNGITGEFALIESGKKNLDSVSVKDAWNVSS